MKTIKTLLFAAALFIGINANAQLGLGIVPFSFGIKGGVNMSNFGGDPKDTDARAGWNAGLTFDLSLPANFYLASGVELTTKGAKYKVDGIDDKISASPLYIQLPVHIGYKINVAPMTRIVFHGGPYWAYGIGGKNKWNGEKHDFFGKDEGEIAKRNDFGLGIGAGVELWKFTAGVGVDFGLLNISRVDNFNVKTQNSYFSLGYKF